MATWGQKQVKREQQNKEMVIRKKMNQKGNWKCTRQENDTENARREGRKEQDPR